MFKWSSALIVLATIALGLSLSNEQGQGAEHEPSSDTSLPSPAMQTAHGHDPVPVPADAPQPALSLKLSQDAVSGYNLHLVLDRYHLSVPPAGAKMSMLMSPRLEPETGFLDGHAHLYINGEKIRRLYGRNEHLPMTLFRPGINQITVTLNDHAHRTWTVRGRKILATLFVDPKASEPVAHRFESFAARQ